MNVLVTAATTPLGRAIVEHLLADRTVGHVLAVGAEHWGLGLPSDGTRFSYEQVDLTRPRAVHDLLYGPARTHGIDTVLHAVLHRAVDDRGARIHAVNVEATRLLVLLCSRHPGIRRFVLRSGGEVYALRSDEPNLIDEDHPLAFDPGAPQWLRDRVEADLVTCAQIGSAGMELAVLRCAEILAEGTGSQLWDYLGSRVCLRPLGFDPMLNVLSVDDAVDAVTRALARDVRGVFNIPGFDTLPLSRLIAAYGRFDVPLPGPLLAPLYRLRSRTTRFEFRYELNLRRFHLGGILDGARARAELGYEPRHSILSGPRGSAGRDGHVRRHPAPEAQRAPAGQVAR